MANVKNIGIKVKTKKRMARANINEGGGVVRAKPPALGKRKRVGRQMVVVLFRVGVFVIVAAAVVVAVGILVV